MLIASADAIDAHLRLISRTKRADAAPLRDQRVRARPSRDDAKDLQPAKDAFLRAARARHGGLHDSMAAHAPS